MDYENTIVACVGTKLIGWSWEQGKSVIYGDKEWVKSMILASASRKLVELHAGAIAGVADISNPKNLLGIFLAMADIPRESIQLLNAPDELLACVQMELTTLNENDEIYDDFETIIKTNYLEGISV